MRKILMVIAFAVLLQSSMYPLVYAQEYTKTEELGGSCNYVRIISLSDSARENLLKLVVEDIDKMKDPTKEEKSLPLTDEQKEILESTSIIHTGGSNFVKEIRMNDTLTKPLPQNSSLIVGNQIRGYSAYLIQLKGSLLICNQNGICTKGGGHVQNYTTPLPKEELSTIENRGEEFKGTKYNGITGTLENPTKVFIAGWSRIKFAQLIQGGWASITDLAYGTLQVIDLTRLGVSAAKKVINKLGTKIIGYDDAVKDIFKTIVTKEPKEAKFEISEIAKKISGAKEPGKEAETLLDQLKSATEGLGIGSKKVIVKKFPSEDDIKKFVTLEIENKLVQRVTGNTKQNLINEINEFISKAKTEGYTEFEVKDGLKNILESFKQGNLLKMTDDEIDTASSEFVNKYIKTETKKVEDLIKDTKGEVKNLKDAKEVKSELNALESSLNQQSFLKELEYLGKQSRTMDKTTFLNTYEDYLKKIDKDVLNDIGYDIGTNNNLYEYFNSLPDIDVIRRKLGHIYGVILTKNPWAQLADAYKLPTGSIDKVKKTFQMLYRSMGRSNDPFFNGELLRHAIDEQTESRFWKAVLVFLAPDINPKLIKFSRGALAFGSFGMFVGNRMVNPATTQINHIIFMLEKTGHNDNQKMIMVMSKDYAKQEFIPSENFLETFARSYFETDAFTNLLAAGARIFGVRYEEPDKLFSTLYKKLQNMGQYILIHDEVTPLSQAFPLKVEKSNLMTIYDSYIESKTENPVERIVTENPYYYMKEIDTYFSAILLFTSKIDAGLMTNVTYGGTMAEVFAAYSGLFTSIAQAFLWGGYISGVATKALDKLSIKNIVPKAVFMAVLYWQISKVVVPSAINSGIYWLSKEDIKPMIKSCEDVLMNTKLHVPVINIDIDKYTIFNLASMALYGVGAASGGIALLFTTIGELALQQWKAEFVKSTWEELQTCYEDKYYIYGINEITIGEKQSLEQTFSQLGLQDVFRREESTNPVEALKRIIKNITGYTSAFRYQPVQLRLFTHQSDFSIYNYDRIYLMYFTPDSEITNIGEKPIEAEMNGESLIIKNGTVVVKNKTTGNEETIFEGPQAFFRNSNLKLGYFAIGNKIIEIDMDEKRELFKYSETTSEIDDCVKQAMEKLGMISPSLTLESLSTPDYDIINLGNAYKIIFHKDVPELDIKAGGSYETNPSDEIIIYRNGDVELRIKGVKTFSSKLQSGSRIFFDNGAAYVKGNKMYLLVQTIYSTNINEFTDVRMNNTQNETGMHIGLHTGDPKVDAWTKHIDAVYKGEKNCTERIDYKNNQLIISCSDGTKDIYKIIGLKSSCVLLEKDGQKYVYTFQMIGNQIYNFIAPGESCADASPEKAVFGPYPISYLWTPNGMVVFNPDTGKVELRNEFAFPLNPAFNYYGGLLQGNSFIPSPNPLGYTPNVDNRKPSGPTGPLIIPSIPEGIYGIFFLLGAGIVMILGHVYLSRRIRNKQNKKR